VSRGMLISMFFRLCSRAPRMTMSESVIVQVPKHIFQRAVANNYGNLRTGFGRFTHLRPTFNKHYTASSESVQPSVTTRCKFSGVRCHSLELSLMVRPIPFA
jgi:hypothetical protein